MNLFLPAIFSDEDVLHPVVENLFGHAAEIVEGMNMAIQESRQIAPIDEFRVDLPGIAEDHREKIELPDHTISVFNLEFSKVHL